MKKVFVSSVVNNFEDMRAAAKRGVELTLNYPVMCELFGSRPHNSEIACMTEVEQSDIYLLILGEKYGWEPPEDTVSVTHREYLTAKAANKPILVFVQDCKKDTKQENFVNEVQDYYTGFFRSTFSTAEELKDAIVHSLNQMMHANESEDEQSFRDKIRRVDTDLQSCYQLNYSQDSALLKVTFCRQPSCNNDIIDIEKNADEYFSRMCKAKLTSLRNGYSIISAPSFTALKSGDNVLIFFENGLVTLLLDPQSKRDNDGFMDSFFIAPSRILQLLLSCSGFIEGYSVWASIKLTGMEQKNFEELPDAVKTSFNMRSFGRPEQEQEFVKLFSPYSSNDYSQWIDNSINIMKRVFY